MPLAELGIRLQHELCQRQVRLEDVQMKGQFGKREGGKAVR